MAYYRESDRSARKWECIKVGRGGSEAVQPRGKEYFITDMASNCQLMLRVESRLGFGRFYSCFKISEDTAPT